MNRRSQWLRPWLELALLAVEAKRKGVVARWRMFAREQDVLSEAVTRRHERSRERIVWEEWARRLLPSVSVSESSPMDQGDFGVEVMLCRGRCWIDGKQS